MGQPSDSYETNLSSTEMSSEGFTTGDGHVEQLVPDC